MGREPKDAASARTRRQNLCELLDDHIRAHGEFTDAELAEARAALYGVEEATAVDSEAADASPVAVTAKAWEHGWELHIEGVGVTQSEGVEDAEAMVRDYLELDGLDRDAPLDITFEFRGHHATSYERSTLLTRCVTIGCA